jgi:hypothetical protein
LRWLAGGFVGALVIVCYQLSASVDQQLLLTYKEFLQQQVLNATSWLFISKPS